MNNILIMTPSLVTIPMLSTFVVEAGGKWEDIINEGIIQHDKQYIWIAGDTTLDPYDNADNIEMLRQKHGIEPMSLLSIEVAQNPDSVELAEKIIAKMLSHFRGIIVE